MSRSAFACGSSVALRGLKSRFQVEHYLMADTRKDQAKLSTAEWKRLVDAIGAVRATGAKSPTWADFVRVHQRAMRGKAMHEWSVHSMQMPDGSWMAARNFLAWHRWYLLKLEQRLQREDEDVTLPYWDWIKDPKIPTQLNRTSLLQRWAVDRQWDPTVMPEREELAAVMKKTKFPVFQSRLETVHNFVHRAVGGQMATARSPHDPIFFLHHANIDRIWARWQSDHKGGRPPNGGEQLQPKPMFGIKVSDVLSLKRLKYSYA
jgi:tyrosinase